MRKPTRLLRIGRQFTKEFKVDYTTTPMDAAHVWTAIGLRDARHLFDLHSRAGSLERDSSFVAAACEELAELIAHERRVFNLFELPVLLVEEACGERLLRGDALRAELAARCGRRSILLRQRWRS